MATVNVTIKNFKFSPNPAPVKTGDSVVWQNKDTTNHTATAEDSSFDTGQIPPGTDSSPVEFDTAGDVPYKCTNHSNMKGTVKVS
jgi:plastocyanin